MDLLAYIQSLWDHWWALMSCAAFTILGVIVLAFNKSNRWALWATFGVAVTLLFVASFLAWHDQYKENSSARESGSLSLEGLTATIDTYVNAKSGAMRVSIVLKNLRERLVEYKMETFDVSVGSHKPEENYLNRGGYIYAGSVTTFRSSNVALEDTTLAKFEGALDYYISYKTTGSRITHHTSKTLRFVVYTSPPHTEFLIAKEHED